MRASWRVVLAAGALLLLPHAGLGQAATAPPGEVGKLVDAACDLATSDLYRGFPDEGLAVVEALLPLAARPDVSPLDRVRLATARGELEHYRASLAGAGQERAVELLRAALAEAEATRHEPSIARAEDLLGLALYAEAFRNGDFATPLPYLERALALRRRLGDARGVAETLFHVGLVHQNRNGATAEDRKRALELYREALPIAREGGYVVEQSYLERHVAAEDEQRGDLDAALAGFTRSLALRRQAGYRIYLAPALLALGGVQLARGAKRDADASYREALEVARETRAARFVVQAHLALARRARDEADRSAAAAHARSALEAARAAGLASAVKEGEGLLEELEPGPARAGAGGPPRS